MVAEHLITGRNGEDAAARFLQSKGLRILERNWRCQKMELDLVCEDRSIKPSTLVFVEVRTRDHKGTTTPAHSLNKNKCKKISKGASLYLSSKDLWSRACRFDFLSVLKHDNSYEVEHVPDAFEFSGTVGGGDTSWQPW